MAYRLSMFWCFDSTGDTTSIPQERLSPREHQALLCQGRCKRSSTLHYPLRSASRYGVLPVFLPQNIPTALLGATLTTVLLGGKAIIVTEFFACLNIAFGNNPDGALGNQDVTVGITGMVDIAGFVLQGLAVNIIAVIEGKNVLIALI